MLKIITPSIFPKDKVIAGVTEKNQHIHPLGFSFAPTEHIDKETVAKHQKLLAKQLQIKDSDFAYLAQTHSDRIVIVEENFEPVEGDAMITAIKGKVLVVKIADCAGVLVYDSANEIVAAIHSGWRGSSKKIVPKTLELMLKKFGSKVENLLVFVSPLASVEKYEVGYEVASLFPNTSRKFTDGKYHFDNKEEILNQLIDFGIQPENIEISNLCTITNENLHSFRRDKEKSGRMACFIGMKKL